MTGDSSRRPILYALGVRKGSPWFEALDEPVELHRRRWLEVWVPTHAIFKIRPGDCPTPDAGILMGVPAQYRAVFSPSARDKVDALGLKGFEWLPVEVQGKAWDLMHVTRRLAAEQIIDLDNSVPDYNDLERFLGLMGARKIAFRPEALDEDIFVVDGEPMLGVYLGTVAGERFEALNLGCVLVREAWTLGQSFRPPPPAPLLPVPDEENPWSQSAEPGARDRQLDLIEAGARRLGVPDPCAADPLSTADKMEKLIQRVKRKRDVLTEEDRVALGFFFCDLVHRHGGWEWVEVMHRDVAHEGWQPAVVDPERKEVILARFIVPFNLDKPRSVEPTLVGQLVSSREKIHGRPLRPKGYVTAT